MDKPKRIVTYYYRSNNISANAVKHVFNLLTIYTGIDFVENNVSPEVVNFIDGNLSDKTKLIIIADDPSCRTDNKVTLNIDPIKELFNKVALRGKLGLADGNELKSESNEKYFLSGIVCSFVDALAEANLIEKPENKINLWPNNALFACAVTHDVDMIHRSVLGSLKLCFKNNPPGGIRGLIDSMKSTMGMIENPYNNFRKWIKIEDDLNIKSTYFVFAGSRDHQFDPKYKLTDMSGSLNELKNNGYEIALHSGIKRGRGENISRPKSDLTNVAECDITGLRPHYLSASLPDYWHSAKAAGFLYSSCLGYDDQIGYFSKIDLPFVPFDLKLDKPIGIVEIPITLMDGGLFSGKYDEPEDSVKEFIMDVSNNGGLLVLDWHQRVLYDPDYPGWGDTFKYTVNIAQENGGCFLQMDEIAKLFDKLVSGAK